MTGQKLDRFEEYFDKKKIMLLDGATGTQLFLMGLKPGGCGELWNLEKPKKLRELAKMYFDAGSDAVLTNTFGAIRFRLGRHGLENSVYELNRAGAENAVSVCPEGKFVIGNIGSVGEFIEPIGNLKKKEVIEAYEEQVRGLVDGGVSAFSLETFADLNEIECAIRAVRDNSDLPYFCSMTFDKTSRGYYTKWGVNISQAVDGLIREGAFAVGSNCGNGIENMVEIAREMRAISSDARIICQPNAGNPKHIGGKDFYTETPEFFVKFLPELLKYKPSVIGGCCGTTPEHIKIMHDFLNRN